METQQRQLAIGFFDALRPEKIMPVSGWADTYRYLAPTASAEPGRWRTSRTPYLKEPMDKLSSHDPTQEIVFMKAAQIGATEMGNNWVGYVMDIAPAPMLMVMPTDETVKRNSKIRIAPMIEATPRLRDKVATAKSRDGDNNTFSKSFPGGVLVMTGANSAVGLRSLPIKYLILDEVDGYKDDIDGEGSPVELARARTRTFRRRKILMISTPTIDGSSSIQREFAITDQRRYFVPCPHCGAMQHLKWERIRWTAGDPTTAHYVCEHCEAPIIERYKTTMLEQGEWTATAPENASEHKVGYHLNSLYSPWFSWADAVLEFEKAKNDPNKNKAFINTVLGECYTEKGEAPAWESVYNKRESYKTNAPAKDVAFLTAGVDVQKDRIEVEIVGWCKGKRSYSIDYRVLLGETNDPKVWDELAKIVGETWTREDGAEMHLRMMAVDTGYNTNHVYNFCRRFDPTRVIPVKGSDSLGVPISQPKALDVNHAGKRIGRMKVWTVGVSMLKSEFYGFLRLEKNEDGSAPPGYCHFPQYGPEYFRGVTAEQLEFKLLRGFRKYQWVKKYDRNEPLDLRIYNRAAASAVGIDRYNDTQIDLISESYGAAVKTVQKTEKKRRSSSYWN